MTTHELVDPSIELLLEEDGAALIDQVEVHVHCVAADANLDVSFAAPSIDIDPCTCAVEEGCPALVELERYKARIKVLRHVHPQHYDIL